MRVYGAKFAAAFVAAYEHLRGLLAASDEWERCWSDRSLWSDFILWGLQRGGDSVLKRTAQQLGLQQWNVGEPFSIDAILVPSNGIKLARNYPLPIIVAVEHENDPRGFVVEQTKLACLRAPLKVGITYLEKPYRNSRPTNLKEEIHSEAIRIAERISEHVGEDPRSEYLFLLGVEASERVLEWHMLSYSAGSGPKTACWDPA